MSPSVAIFIAVVSILANAFFVAAEFALLASRRSRIEQLAGDGRAGALAATKALRELTLMLAGAQFGITAATIVLGAVAEPAIATLLEGPLDDVGIPHDLVHPIAFTIALAIVVFAHMVLGEMAPKSWAIVDPERAAMLLAIPFRAFTLAFRPFLVLLNSAANALLRLVRVTPQDERMMQAGPAELAVLLEESVEVGKLDVDEAEQIGRALGLSGLTASTAMVPADRIDGVAATAGVDAIEAAAAPRRRSRIVIFASGSGGGDEPAGVVHMRDVLTLEPAQRSGRSADELAYSLVRVDAETPLEDVLLTMQRERRHVAAVYERERFAGIVTMQDVLRSLIGRRAVDVS